MRERLGFLPPSVSATSGRSVWFHAVSVGEVLSALELIRRLRSECPHLLIYLSTTTLAGRSTAEQRLGSWGVRVFFAPLDYRSTVRRVLRKLRPSALIVLETEIWPNLYREAKHAGASLVIVNGRISDRALPRYRAFRWFFRHVLSQADGIFVQSLEDARRYAEAGAPSDRVHAAGNLKYDFTPPSSGIAQDIAAVLQSARPQAVWIAASTMPPKEPGDPDEDDEVLRAFQALSVQFPSLLLILAPRRPERFEAAAAKLAAANIPYTRRSALNAIQLPAVLLLDSIGELGALFERATVVFMGGTLASRGGHNILEPAYFAKPVIVGPHMENFATIAQEFSAGGAMIRIAEASDLAPAVARLLHNASECAVMGERARELGNAKRGAAARLAGEIVRAAADGFANPCRTLPARLLLTPLSWLWAAGNRWNLSRRMARRQSLSTRVVSVGSLAMGGAGKSPLVAHLAERLSSAGRNVAILTRGYRRKAGTDAVIRKGQKASLATTGDEAQIFVQAARAHVGISANRFRVGRRIEKELSPDVFLLDDGFQHAGLKRDQDIVLIDAMDPLASGIFPLGRRREGLESLARATVVIVTRVETGEGIAGIERLIRRYNRNAPIFTSRVVPKRWRSFSSKTEVAPPTGPVAAFCGLGQPRAFWGTLESLGIQVAFRQAFGDHHPYRPSELKRLAAQAAESGVKAFVTTEKDMMNLPENAATWVHPRELLWLEIGVEIENEAELLRRIG